MSQIQNIINRLSLREKLAQLCLLDLREYPHSPNQISEALATDGLGGIIVFAGREEDAASLIAQYQSQSDIPLLVSSDFERGVGQRLTPGLEYPHNMAFGATQNPEYAREQAKYIAREAKRLGVHLIHAPVADLNTQPKNPIINIRAYGDSAIEASRFVRAFVEGIEAEGLAACAKHFPGHGNATEDSHINLPLVDMDYACFTQRESLPFQAAIDGGVSCMMIAHAAYPALTGKIQPATFSEEIVTGLLKDKLQFRGVITSDALNMGALTQHFSEAESAVLAVKAGIDLLVCPPSYMMAVNALERAVQTGKISIENVEASLRKILGLKEKLALLKSEGTRAVGGAEGKAGEDSAEGKLALLKGGGTRAIVCSGAGDAGEALALEVGRRSITVVSRQPGFYESLMSFPASCSSFLPLKAGGSVHLCVVGDEYSDVNNFVGLLLHAPLPVRLLSSHYLGPETKDFPVFPGDSTLLMPVFSSTRAWKGSVELPPQLVEYIELCGKNCSRLVVCVLGSPYICAQIRVPFYVVSYSDSLVSQKALIDVLCGKYDVQGKLPVAL